MLGNKGVQILLLGSLNLTLLAMLSRNRVSWNICWKVWRNKGENSYRTMQNTESSSNEM